MYANDTSFYTAIGNPHTESIAPAVIATESWSDQNFMSLKGTLASQKCYAGFWYTYRLC